MPLTVGVYCGALLLKLMPSMFLSQPDGKWSTTGAYDASCKRRYCLMFHLVFLTSPADLPESTAPASTTTWWPTSTTSSRLASTPTTSPITTVITMTDWSYPTRSPESDGGGSSHVGTIAGGVVGGVVGLCAIGVAIAFILKRKWDRDHLGRDGAGGTYDSPAPPMVQRPNVRHFHSLLPSVLATTDGHNDDYRTRSPRRTRRTAPTIPDAAPYAVGTAP